MARYVDAFERYDITSLVKLLARGRVVHDAAVRAVAGGTGRDRRVVCRAGERVPRLPAGRHGGQRLPRLRQLQAALDGNGWEPFDLHIVEVSDGRISGLHHFLYPELFAGFGLPTHLDG